jgi:hypothetical protein
MEEMRYEYRIFVGKHPRKHSFVIGGTAISFSVIRK